MRPPDVHVDEMLDDDPQLAAFARDLRDAAVATAPPVAGSALSSILTDGLAPVGAATSPARRRRWARGLVGGIVVGFGVGGLGIAGALPAPVQRGVASVAEVVGIDLPSPAKDHAPAAEVPVPTLPDEAPFDAPPSRVHGGTFDEDVEGEDEVDADRSGRGRGKDANPAVDAKTDDRSGPGSARGRGSADDLDGDDDATDETEVESSGPSRSGAVTPEHVDVDPTGGGGDAVELDDADDERSGPGTRPTWTQARRGHGADHDS